MNALLRILLDWRVQREFGYHNYRFSDYAEALEDLWPEICKLRGMKGLRRENAKVEVLGCGADAIAFSIPGTTYALKFTGAEWQNPWGRRYFDGKVFWRRESGNVTVYLQQSGEGSVTPEDAAAFACELGERWDCWDGSDGTEIDMSRQLLYAHPADERLERGVEIGERYVILIDPDAVCKMGAQDTFTARMSRLAAREDREAEDPEESWD